MPSVQYYCPCLSTSIAPPSVDLPSSVYSFHDLHTLYFCTEPECMAIRCNRCVSVEVNGYYCPNCLFEVPSASVRAEKNRCARNCFQCPNCRNTLVIVASDPPEGSLSASTAAAVGVSGQPPYFLYCNFCRWDSTEVGITFEKATGLAGQLQKSEESAPDVIEFERLKEHFEPFLRAAPSGGIAHAHSNPITSAASSALSRDISIPGLSKYSALLAGRRGRNDRDRGTTSKDKEELAEFRSRWETSGSASAAEAEVDWIKRLEDVAEVATIEERWVGSWLTSMRARDLRPLRIPLHSKKTKRCPTCRHIIIKPEQKSQSVRYKMKLTASNFVPAISVSITPLTATAAAKAADAPATFHAGRTYPFRLAFTNPLYEPTTVTLTVQRAPMLRGRPPFAVSLPSPPFQVSAYAEAWEYEDEDEEADDDIDALLAGVASPSSYTQTRDAAKPKKQKTVGVLERKANTTVVGGELVIGKEGRGDAKFNLMVTHTYQAEDTAGQDTEDPKSTAARISRPTSEVKTFSFFVVVDLGVIIPKEKDDNHKRDSEQMSVS